jgi:WD40 repeat protein
MYPKVASHDGFIDVYSYKFSPTANSSTIDALNVELKPLKRLKGHHSYVAHVDWSADNSLLQSTCGAYELLYWSVTDGTQLLSTDDNLEADSEWATRTCPLGFGVMGIWPPAADGTDINSVDVIISAIP